MTSMRLAWKLGRVAGIDFYVHPTFLVVFFLFPGVFPGGALSPLNILLVLTVFGCVLLHELGHALTARRFGINTHDITLYPIGGVARLERMPRAPGAELLIALAGPAVNFAIVLGLIALLVLGGDLLSPYSWPALFVQQVLVVNLVLGLFNLIPAFPMDGGRVLRALLSGWLGRVRATMTAARVGRARWLLSSASCLWPITRSRSPSFTWLWPGSSTWRPRAKRPRSLPRRDAGRDLAPTTRASGPHRPDITGSVAAMASGNWHR